MRRNGWSSRPTTSDLTIASVFAPLLFLDLEGGRNTVVRLCRPTDTTVQRLNVSASSKAVIARFLRDGAPARSTWAPAFSWWQPWMGTPLGTPVIAVAPCCISSAFAQLSGLEPKTRAWPTGEGWTNSITGYAQLFAQKDCASRPHKDCSQRKTIPQESRRSTEHQWPEVTSLMRANMGRRPSTRG